MILLLIGLGIGAGFLVFVFVVLRLGILIRLILLIRLLIFVLLVLLVGVLARLVLLILVFLILFLFLLVFLLLIFLLLVLLLFQFLQFFLHEVAIVFGVNVIGAKLQCGVVRFHGLLPALDGLLRLTLLGLLAAAIKRVTEVVVGVLLRGQTLGVGGGFGARVISETPLRPAGIGPLCKPPCRR